MFFSLWFFIESYNVHNGPLEARHPYNRSFDIVVKTFPNSSERIHYGRAEVVLVQSCSFARRRRREILK